MACEEGESWENCGGCFGEKGRQDKIVREMMRMRGLEWVGLGGIQLKAEVSDVGRLTECNAVLDIHSL